MAKHEKKEAEIQHDKGLAHTDGPQPQETKVPAVKEQGTAVQLNQEVNDLLSLGDEQDDFGRQDLAIPFLQILQKLSPQVDKTNNAFIAGAEPGMIFNNVTGETYDEKKGVIVVPVLYQRELNEWVPREKGGGLVGAYGTDLSKLDTAKKDDKGKMITPEGNSLVEAGTYYCYIVDPDTGHLEQAVIAMSSTNFKSSRNWNTLIRTARIPNGSGGMVPNPAPFAQAYRLTSQRVDKNNNTWWVWDVEAFALTSELPDGVSMIKQAVQLRQMVKTGAVKVQYDQAQSDDASSGSAAQAHNAF